MANLSRSRSVFRVLSLQDYIDIKLECVDPKLDGKPRRARSISNCPYQVKTLDQ